MSVAGPFAKSAEFDAKVAALISQGYSKESAEKIAASTCSKHGGNAPISAVVKGLQNEKQIALCVTNVVAEADGTPVVDYQGDVIAISNLEDAFTKAFAPSSTETSGVMHEARGDSLARVVQHMTFSRDDWKALTPYIGKEIGVVKIRVADAYVWQAVKNGELPEVSIEGDGERKAL